jgi:hypothetical protein
VGGIAENLQPGIQSGCDAQVARFPKQVEIDNEEKEKEIRDLFVTKKV